MKLIVGLGNPGAKYDNTRHNIGADVLLRYTQVEGVSWEYDKKYKAEVAKMKIEGEQVVLMRPLTYMNLSGQAVAPFLQFYKLTPEDLLVLHDEIDLQPAEIKQKTGGGHAGHNGLRDIIAKLGTNTFHRIRIGVGRPIMKEQVADYVLSSFVPQERDDIYHKMDEMELMMEKFVL